MAGIEAVKDEEHSTPGREIWRGVAGGLQPVRLEFNHQQSRIIRHGQEDEVEDTLSARVYREPDSLSVPTPEPVAQAASNAEITHPPARKQRFQTIRKLFSGRRRTF